LAIMASLLIIMFQASVNRLIPLYAIGVFLSFTLSQSGMAHRWWKSGRLKAGEEKVEVGSVLHHDKRWKFKMLVNGFGAVTTFVVMIVFGVTKFKDGAWIIVFIIPLLVTAFFSVHHHYKALAKKLSLENFNSAPRVKRHRVLVLIAGVHRGSLAALSYAQTLGDDITAVHVSIDPQESEKVRAKWDIYGDGTRLVILESPYRLLVEPVLDYINKLSEIKQPNEMLTIVVPQFIPAHWWENFLHNQTALLLRFALIFKPGLVIVEVPYQV